MGADVIRKMTDSFQRKLRRCLDAFDVPNLFSGHHEISVVLVVVPRQQHELLQGREYRVEHSDGEILIVERGVVVGEVEQPPESVLDTMKSVAGPRTGKIVRLFKYGDCKRAELELG